ncbi:pyrroline-5-carboxylate reductase [Fonticella tunisiensis]|uniref:Pyrroline-5-carboxylate reductase n=1 Tax=Fonticella tunisiensis TaxID=1096341 RepID=A0A4R7KRV0_9CLOT|nr:pyrroline-5-carboxylate reductase [Fonticella tunisiensis]TDT61537.1 pyrroline-5-carboxylate reductase [Fonticella tunisiensis]
MIGFIGAGNMATAIIKGMLEDKINKENIFVYDVNGEKLQFMSKLGVNICSGLKELVTNSKYIFLSVKPNVYDSVLNEIKDIISEEKVIVTMAAGYEIARVKSIIGNKKTVRTMPNTPALVGQGFTAVCFDELIEEEEKEKVISMLKTFSHVQEIKEPFINAYSAVSGSGPAFVFMLIEAMADAAVLMGIPRAEAYRAVEATVLGSASLALKTGKHPGELKDMVCSPGGTTIEGVRTLEEKNFRGAVIECLINTYKKNLDITKIR